VDKLDFSSVKLEKQSAEIEGKRPAFACKPVGCSTVGFKVRCSADHASGISVVFDQLCAYVIIAW
jgi:hypothetical protein